MVPIWHFASRIIFGERQMVAQPMVRRLLVFPLINTEFRVCHPPLICGNVASAHLNHQKRHVDWLYSPQDENGRIEHTSLPVAGRPATRLGRKSACRYGPPGPIFLQAPEGQGAFARPDWYSGFLLLWEVAKSPI
jgi:hypothetical protein